MPINRLKTYLDQQNVRYVTISHSPAFTAPEIAASAHIPGKAMAKTVMVTVNGRMAMAVLPASYHVDLDQLAEAIGADEVAIAQEWEFRRFFPDCEVGAMSPFGHLYGLDVYVADRLAEDDEIAFNAGSHTELIRMSYKDFERLAKPRVIHFATAVF